MRKKHELKSFIKYNKSYELHNHRLSRWCALGAQTFILTAIYLLDEIVEEYRREERTAHKCDMILVVYLLLGISSTMWNRFFRESDDSDWY